MAWHFVKPLVARQFTRCMTTTETAVRSTRRIVIYPQEPLDKGPAASGTWNARARMMDTNLLGSKEGAALLDGLDIYSVPALDDHHPLAVYGLDSTTTSTTTTTSTNLGGGFTKQRHPIVLLHGRTWSSVPVYHLLGGNWTQQSRLPNTASSNATSDSHESRSLMEALLHMGLQPYAMDFRGFGGTPSDDTGYVEPLRCVKDVQSVLLWIAQRHGTPLEQVGEAPDIRPAISDASVMPALLGWSQGALVAQLVAQYHPEALSKLVLYGSIYDPLVRYPREPLYRINEPNASRTPNTFNDAIEDFTVQGTIPPEPARLFAEAALVSDPVKAVWKHLYQFNNCDPARVHVPTLVVAGDQDPYAPLHVQQELFCNLGRGSDRTWSILADADHAAHLLNQVRHRFVNITTSFVKNGKRGQAE
jgi:pimeloyl-ACP methyl ester carboxylesterase